MVIEILIPAMSPNIRTGRLVRWLVAPGDVVRPGDVLAEIETQTATMEIEAVDGGRVVRILIPSGTDGVAVDTPIALIEPEGALVHPFPDTFPTAAARGSGQAARDARSRRRLKASPLARKRARAAGLALDELQGSGPAGRIIARDVAARQAAAGGADEFIARTGSGGRTDAAPVAAPVVSLHYASEDKAGRRLTHVGGLLTGAPTGPPTISHGDIALAREAYAPGSYVARSHDPRWRMMLDRLEMAHAHVPQQTLHANVRFDDLDRALQRMNVGVHTSSRRVPSLSVSDVLVKAMGLALRQVPEANVSFTRSAMLHHGGADVAVALMGEAAEDGDDWHRRLDLGIAAPVLAHADLKSLSEISQELQTLREMARSGHLDEPAVRGGVTTIYDLCGSVASGLETLVIPPQSSVLVMGAVEAKALIVDGAVSLHRCARLSLSVDQRAIDSRVAMRLLGVLKVYVEDPMRMLV